MDSIRFRNYKCFDDTGEVSIKPLTFLLGANSSGKSSFIEFFPLLKQSVGVRRNGLFLWYSNEVDFQDFSNTVKDGNGCMEISLKYDSFVDNSGKPVRQLKEYHLESEISLKDIGLEASMTVALRRDNYDYLEKLKISFLDNLILLDIEKNNVVSITINGRYFGFPEWEMKMSGSTTSFLPRVLFVTQWEKSKAYSPYPRFIDEQDFLGGALDSEQKEMVFFKEVLYLKQNEYVKFFNRMLGRDDIDFELLRDIYLLANLNDILELLNSRLSYEGAMMSYIKPLRVTTERYYRYQNYAVDEIDSDGKNLAMYFANLTDLEFEAFRNWTNTNFDFKIYISKHEGHIELKIGEDENSARNLVDVGFGYTQLLPIITIVWQSIHGTTRRNYYPRAMNGTKIIAIEQPELHLHPRVQASFAEMLARVIGNLKPENDIRFIIETHSETIINTIGSLIQSSSLKKDKVNVVLFNAKQEGLEKYIEESSFDDNGYLNKWPMGFFM